MADKNWELELNEYIRQGEPDKVDDSKCKDSKNNGKRNGKWKVLAEL